MYKNRIMYPASRNCYVYDTPVYNIEVTIEENLCTAVSLLKGALRDRRKGINNLEYLNYCKNNLKQAIHLARTEPQI